MQSPFTPTKEMLSTVLFPFICWADFLLWDYPFRTEKKRTFGPSMDGFKNLEADGKNTLMSPVRRGRLCDFNSTDNMRTYLLETVACLPPIPCTLVRCVSPIALLASYRSISTYLFPVLSVHSLSLLPACKLHKRKDLKHCLA